jgi:EpsG family
MKLSDVNSKSPVLYDDGYKNVSFNYWLAIAAICVIIATVWGTTYPDRFADFDTYVLYLDQLVHFPPDNWWYFESMSNLYLLTIHGVYRSVIPSIAIAHYVLGIMFIVFLIISFPPRLSSWPSIVFLFCFLGPVLAFVTLRATPAYFLVAAGALRAMRRDPSAWIYIGTAFLFHASTLLAVPPMLLLYFQNHVPNALKGRKSLYIFIPVMTLYFASSFLLPQFTDIIISTIQGTPYLAKYIAYTDEVLPASHVTSSNHYIFLVFVVLYTTVFFARSRKEADPIMIYIIPSVLIYSFMFTAFSPVAAFRQAPFFLIPMISLFPWHRVGIKGPASVLFVVLCAALFVFQFDQVYL